MSKERHYSAAKIRDASSHFVIGKIGTGLLAMGWLVLLVRYMDAPEYGTYVACLAIFEVTNSLSGMGIGEAIQRFLPEVRILGGNQEFGSFLMRALRFRLLSAALFGSAMYLAFDTVTRLAGVSPQPGLAPVFTAFFMGESVLRFFNDHLLGALLAQKTAQRILMVKNSVRLLAGLALIGIAQPLTLNAAFSFEVTSAVCALLFAFPEVRQIRREGRLVAQADNAEAVLNWRAIWRYGTFAYLSLCTYQVYGSDALRLIVSRFMGSVEMASYGMAAALADTLKRYLPLFLLIAIIRPTLVARYTENRDPAQLNHLCNLVYKINLFFLAPIIASMAVVGDQVGDWISAGKYTHAGMLLTLMTALLATQSLRLIFSMLSATYTFPATTFTATLASTAGLPISILLGLKFGSIGVLGGSLASDLIWITVLVFRLYFAKCSFIPDWLGIGKLAVAAVAATEASKYFSPYANDVYSLALAGTLVFVTYVTLAYILRPFGKEDWTVMKKLKRGRKEKK